MITGRTNSNTRCPEVLWASRWTTETAWWLFARISATDGRRAVITKLLPIRDPADAVLLRTERAIARVGEEVPVGVLTTADKGTAYLDVIRGGQTILTRAQMFSGGRAAMLLPLGDD